MIKISQAQEPADFDEKVRRPGLRFLKEHPDSNPKDFWSACKGELYAAYRGYCAYTTFRIVPRTDATVDHFMPKSIRRDLSYEWSNYRLCSPHANAVKKDATGLLDPVSLPENAFFLREDGSIEANPAAFSSENELASAVHTVSRLRLNSPALVYDRAEHLDTLLANIAEASPENRDAACRCAARSLRRQSRFLYEQAVRMNYIPALAD